jgi:hypothetical protein
LRGIYVFLPRVVKQFGQVCLLNDQVLLGSAHRAFKGIAFQPDEHVTCLDLVTYVDQDLFHASCDTKRKFGFLLGK